ncbi:hypothetical protein Vretimale_5233 [Volvox reticuliferus]|uniref:Uncharacterized protein n=1 Tax=Volvox reticuliferus TaxID=1737510 RepID=A0A8J4LJW4_9CHLO|nr:hypothetical protein Vretifemale_3604 [Volvox reticuliferus]GIM00482.1 hypothetical protein Vretimale_5233 [Volvox reticuliferus]
MASRRLAPLARWPRGALPFRALIPASSSELLSLEGLKLQNVGPGQPDEPPYPSTSASQSFMMYQLRQHVMAAFEPPGPSLPRSRAISVLAGVGASSSSCSSSSNGYRGCTSAFRSFASTRTATEPLQGQPTPSTSTSTSTSTSMPQKQQQEQQEQGHLPRPPNDVEYVGPLSQQHKLLKRISIANTVVAAAAAPAIVAFADNISLVSRYGLAASLLLFGIATTGALHWVANPYVHELRYTAVTGQIDVRTTTLLGNSKWHSFNVDEVRPLPWNRPVATFTARDRFYYIDVYSFPDEQLLRRLTPDEADVPKGFKDKEDDDDD